jgi:ABC-type multidrug transport system fused ATPase/permease subunit
MSSPRYALHCTGRDGTARSVEVGDGLVIGRSGVDLVLDDPAVSRRHCTVAVDGGALVIVDHDSANGTQVNGRRVQGRTTLQAGDRVVVGDTTIVVVRVDRPVDAGVDTDPRDRGRDAVRVVHTASTHGARVAAQVRTAAGAAWPRLARLLPEGLEVIPTIRLVDPHPDPARSGELVVAGSSVDATRHEVWMVVTADAPPDEPAHALALLVADLLPAGADLAFLLEGYGLHVAGVGDTDPLVRADGVRPPSRTEGDARLAAAVSFVRFLLDRGGPELFESLVREAEPGHLAEALQRTYGSGLGPLEHRWMQTVERGGVTVPARQFLRLSIQHLRPYRWRQAESFVYMALGMAFTMAFPFVTRELFDDAIPSGSFDRVLVLLAVLGAAFIVSLLAGLRQVWLNSWVSGAVIRDLRTAMFERLQRLPQSWFDRRDAGDVLSRLFSDVDTVEAGLSQTLSDGALQILTVVVASAVMITVDWRLAIVVLVVAPVVGLVYRSMGGGARARSSALQEESSAQLGLVSENLAAQQIVKLFGLAPREERRFALASDRVLRAERRLTLFGGLFGLTVNMLVVTMRLVVLALGAWLVLEDRLTLGGLVAFLSIMGEVIGPVTSLTNLGQSIQRSSGALVRIHEVLHADVEPEAVDAVALPRLHEAIRFERVSFSYGDDHPVLRDITLTIPAGAKVAFVGPSGSGKSTLLRLLMRLYDPTEGAVRFDGTDVRDASLASLRGQLGIVLQDPLLFNTSVFDNIALGDPAASHDTVRAAARAAEVDSFVGHLAAGYDTIVGDRGSFLSGGQRQRVSIARALVRDPAVLLFDEATSALDPRTERQISETIARIGEGRTIVSVTHRLTSVTDYDCIVVLADGSVVEQGTHHDLLAQGGLYAKLWAEQLGDGEGMGEGTMQHDHRPPASARRVELATGVMRAAMGGTHD